MNEKSSAFGVTVEDRKFDVAVVERGYLMECICFERKQSCVMNGGISHTGDAAGKSRFRQALEHGKLFHECAE